MNEVIFNINPWWKTHQVKKTQLGSIKREPFLSLIKSLTKNNKILCLYGPRRAGKTTLLYEMINFLIKEQKVSTQRILFLTFDSYKLSSLDFDSIIYDFCQYIEEPTDNLKDNIYIFCDEIHKLDNWANKIKYWHDNNTKIKFVISGSSTSNILKGSGESLMGRINFQLILPLSFQELLADKLEKKLIDTELSPFNTPLLNHQYRHFQKYQQEILILLRRYMHLGGFPEIQFIKNVEHAYETLKNYKFLTLNRDILEIKDIKEPKTLSDLFDLTTDFMSQRVNFSHFASALKIKIDTVKLYLSFLEEAFLLYTSSIYSKSHIINTRKEKKLYFFDAGIRNACLFKEINQQQYELIAENLVFTHLYKLKSKELSPKIFYYLDKQKNEVDFIITLMKKDFPLEVKYGNNPYANKFKGLKSFSEQYGFKTNIILTKDTFKKDKNKIFLPLWLFLLTTKA